MQFKEDFLRYYLIGGTQNINFNEQNFLTKLELALKNGITAFQFREKEDSQLSYQQKVELGLKIKNLTNEYNVPLFVDDDVDLAININADGVHFGQSDDSLSKRNLAHKHQLMIGLSINNLDELANSDLTGIDYLGCGPIYNTQSKKDPKKSIGINGLNEIIDNTNLPIVSIGGINLDSISDLHQAGINNYSFISLIFSSSNIQQTMENLRRITNA
ncbi:thiamine phosphate synthase [Lactobacillus sp. S2-2]|uniref:thiamine phosphate synthase n=1 Tax=Lactobacillus sp. S2-2 TaxID=2692917 RepID=UPI001F015E50|nr:thiamine phosphate synthase [Lactobacillus sp. S2-2]MCF6514692.1 thiamine phosphate synthase [Lactobacillus sp. S2-2]